MSAAVVWRLAVSMNQSSFELQLIKFIYDLISLISSNPFDLITLNILILNDLVLLVHAEVHALIEGPGDTPYDGGLFHFILFVKPSYPHEPPLARFMTTDHGRVRFNPQFYTSGKVCLSILNTWPGPGWNPAFTLRLSALSETLSVYILRITLLS